MQAYGLTFVPYVRDEIPFEDVCRELWCSNFTHALRAHPALQGTDCSAQPFPDGSWCVEGVCTPYRDDDADQDNSEDSSKPAEDDSTNQDEDYNDVDLLNSIDGTPSWYDPIYNKMFTNLRKEFEDRHPHLIADKKSTSQLQSASNSSIIERKNKNCSHICSANCGGGWTELLNNPCSIIPCP